jgi:hypothetical protein
MRLILTSDQYATAVQRHLTQSDRQGWLKAPDSGVAVAFLHFRDDQFTRRRSAAANDIRGCLHSIEHAHKGLSHIQGVSHYLPNAQIRPYKPESGFPSKQTSRKPVTNTLCKVGYLLT